MNYLNALLGKVVLRDEGKLPRAIFDTESVYHQHNTGNKYGIGHMLVYRIVA
jgi:hypothetical protein